jgi:pimeloyl-ACP methyl ester carboxylesterase
MSTVQSADGTTIAYDRLGSGPPLIVVGGATCDRARTRPTAEGLAGALTVLDYDRRGRGESGDTPPYAVEREVEDLAALIEAAGGRAALYGHSSGAGLALHAAAAGLPVERLILHDPPYAPDDEAARREAREIGQELRDLISAGRRGDAMERFLTAVGMPEAMVAEMRAGDPSWAGLEALAHTLDYDSRVMGDVERDGAVPADLAARVRAETLVLCGGANPPFMLEACRELVAALPAGRLRVLEGHDHVVPPEDLAPVVAEFLGVGSRTPPLA